MEVNREKIFRAFLKSRKVCIDTRKIAKGDIYFALKGDRFNGNDFLQQALNEGCDWVVGDEPRLTHDRFILVENALTSLQQLAKDYRSTWKCPVLAITGSNGKTTTKELIRDVLATQKKVYATRGNLNNHIGIPLTILETPDDVEIAIIEMGANHQKEIESYCEYTLPTHGIITNIGKAHLEGFGGIAGVQKGKRELYDFLFKNKGIIFCNISQAFMEEWRALFSPIEYSHQDYRAEDIGEGMAIECLKDGRTFKSQLTGTYNINNIAAALAIGKYFGISDDAAVQAIAAYQPENMRSQWQRTEKNELIIDAYNANPTSLENALRNLSNSKEVSTLAIVGEMREMGEFSHLEHEKLVDLIEHLSLDCVLVGKEFKELKRDYLWFENVDDLIHHITKCPISGKRILIKGSRGIQLEKVLPYL
jgi:UDP-N-acetylmuramoyl-tripeptide--D-alanyl-D-alanine ligase